MRGAHSWLWPCRQANGPIAGTSRRGASVKHAGEWCCVVIVVELPVVEGGCAGCCDCDVVVQLLVSVAWLVMLVVVTAGSRQQQH